MHDSVRKIFPSFSEKFEGRVNWPYLDIRGLPTVGIGCLVNSVRAALALPWQLVGGGKATPLQVSAQWTYLKDHPSLAQAGARACESATLLRLTDADVDALLRSRLAQNETILAAAFAGWENYPADAQLAVHSMAWAMGADFWKDFPRFKRACEAHDWDLASAECIIAGEETNLGLIPRNLASRVCLCNAARVRENSIALKASEVYWPLELTKGVES